MFLTQYTIDTRVLSRNSGYTGHRLVVVWCLGDLHLAPGAEHFLRWAGGVSAARLIVRIQTSTQGR